MTFALYWYGIYVSRLKSVEMNQGLFLLIHSTVHQMQESLQECLTYKVGAKSRGYK